MSKVDVDALEYAVLFKGPYDNYWSTIAAFNCLSAAKNYAKECEAGWGHTHAVKYYRVEITPAEKARQDAQELAELREEKRANWSYQDDNEE